MSNIQKELYGSDYKLWEFVKTLTDNPKITNCSFGSISINSTGDVFLCPRISDLKSIGNIRNPKKRRGVQPRMGLQQDEQRTGCRLVPWAGGRGERRAVHGGAAPRLADGGNAGAVPGLQGQDPGMGAVCAEPPLGGDLRRSPLSGVPVRCRHRRDDPGSPAHWHSGPQAACGKRERRHRGRVAQICHPCGAVHLRL